MFKSILVPIDVAHRSSWQFALPQAIELAKAGGSALTVMTVVRDLKAMLEGVHLGYQLEQMVADAEGKLAIILDPYRADGVSIQVQVRTGSIAHEILAAARSHGADLILMASHRPEMRDYLIGPNAAHVAQHASCSVLVLRRFESAPN
jgi:nucleotide-binding universal stress UspA family protein